MMGGGRWRTQPSSSRRAPPSRLVSVSPSGEDNSAGCCVNLHLVLGEGYLRFLSVYILLLFASKLI